MTQPPYKSLPGPIAVCIKSSRYGQVGELAGVQMMKSSDKTWTYVSELVLSGNWRLANDIEAAAYAYGHRNMRSAWDYNDAINLILET